MGLGLGLGLSLGCIVHGPSSGKLNDALKMAVGSQLQRGMGHSIGPRLESQLKGKAKMVTNHFSAPQPVGPVNHKLGFDGFVWKQ